MIFMMELVQHTIFPPKEFFYASHMISCKHVKGKNPEHLPIKSEFRIIPSHSYDGDAFHNHEDSKFKHERITLANTNGSPLAVGGSGNSRSHKKSETYDISTNTWNEIADYPYAS